MNSSAKTNIVAVDIEFVLPSVVVPVDGSVDVAVAVRVFVGVGVPVVVEVDVLVTVAVDVVWVVVVRAVVSVAVFVVVGVLVIVDGGDVVAVAVRVGDGLPASVCTSSSSSPPNHPKKPSSSSSVGVGVGVGVGDRVIVGFVTVPFSSSTVRVLVRSVVVVPPDFSSGEPVAVPPSAGVSVTTTGVVVSGAPSVVSVTDRRPPGSAPIDIAIPPANSATPHSRRPYWTDTGTSADVGAIESALSPPVWPLPLRSLSSGPSIGVPRRLSYPLL